MGKENWRGMSAALAIFVVSLLLLIVAFPFVRAEKTVTIPVLGVVQAGSFDLDEGEEVDYSWAANGLVMMTVTAHLEMPGHNQDDTTVSAILNFSAEGTFEAPYTPPDVGAWIYNFSFINFWYQEVEVTYDIDRIRSSGPMIFLVSFAVVIILAILFAAAMLRRARR